MYSLINLLMPFQPKGASIETPQILRAIEMPGAWNTSHLQQHSVQHTAHGIQHIAHRRKRAGETRAAIGVLYLFLVNIFLRLLNLCINHCN